MDQSQVESRMTSPFETTANISYKDIKATARIVSEEPRSCTVSFTSPSSLNGMSFAFAKDKLTVDYNGISFDLDPSNLPVERWQRWWCRQSIPLRNLRASM